MGHKTTIDIYVECNLGRPIGFYYCCVTTITIIIIISYFLKNKNRTLKITAITCYDSSFVLDRDTEGGEIVIAFGPLRLMQYLLFPHIVWIFFWVFIFSLSQVEYTILLDKEHISYSFCVLYEQP